MMYERWRNDQIMVSKQSVKQCTNHFILAYPPHHWHYLYDSPSCSYYHHHYSTGSRTLPPIELHTCVITYCQHRQERKTKLWWCKLVICWWHPPTEADIRSCHSGTLWLMEWHPPQTTKGVIIIGSDPLILTLLTAWCQAMTSSCGKRKLLTHG